MFVAMRMIRKLDVEIDINGNKITRPVTPPDDAIGLLQVFSTKEEAFQFADEILEIALGEGEE